MSKNKRIVELSNNSARNTTVNCLLAFERNGKFVQDSLDQIFLTGKLSEPDKRLAAELSYGTCRQLISLDYILAKFCSRPLRKVDITVLQILRVGVYQMLFLSRTPDFAVISEAVDQAKKSGLTGADGFVNGVLRSVQRSQNSTETSIETPGPRRTFWSDQSCPAVFSDNLLPDPKTQPDKHCSAAYGYPRWLTERWLKQFGPEKTRQICLAGNARPPLTLRVNTLKATPDELWQKLTQANLAGTRYGQSIQMTNSGRIENLPGYSEGLFAVQDLTAQEAVGMLEPKPTGRILDLCAAPGGKTMQIAELMANQGEIWACDVSDDKLSLITENCQRLGVTIVKTVLADVLEGRAAEIKFDAILADVPCSNTGVLARRVEARHQLNPGGLQQLVRQQQAILHQAAAMLKEGGRLVYSTCSIEEVENSLAIRRFLERHRNFELIEEKLVLPGNFTPEGEPDSVKLSHDGGYRAALSRTI